LELCYDRVRRAVDLPVVEAVFDGNGGCTTELNETDPASRLLGLVADVTFRDFARHRVAGLMASADKAIRNGDLFDG